MLLRLCDICTCWHCSHYADWRPQWPAGGWDVHQVQSSRAAKPSNPNLDFSIRWAWPRDGNGPHHNSCFSSSGFDRLATLCAHDSPRLSLRDPAGVESAILTVWILLLLYEQLASSDPRRAREIRLTPTTTGLSPKCLLVHAHDKNTHFRLTELHSERMTNDEYECFEWCQNTFPNCVPEGSAWPG